MTDEQIPPAAEAQESPHYRLIQKGVTVNIPASDLESLVTHHPGANRNAVFRDGVPIGVEDPGRRSYGMVGSELQELETQRTDGGARSVLGEHQVLLMKDFMLEDSRIHSRGAGVRDVDVPSPVAGYVGRRIDAQGLVEIYDRQGGEVVARLRHLSGISVNVGDTVEYARSSRLACVQASPPHPTAAPPRSTQTARAPRLNNATSRRRQQCARRSILRWRSDQSLFERSPRWWAG